MMLARSVIEKAQKMGVRIATAESCTGGMIAAALTDVPGSSSVFDRGFVTYSNAAKTDMLGVPAALIADHGAVSDPVARSMAEGALTRSEANISVSVTGIAGPGGGSAEKPVGLVFVAVAINDQQVRSTRHEFGDLGRAAVRQATVEKALAMVLEALHTYPVGSVPS